MLSTLIFLIFPSMGHASLLSSTYFQEFSPLKKKEIIVGILRPAELGFEKFDIILPNPLLEIIGGAAGGIGGRYKFQKENFYLFPTIFGEYSLVDKGFEFTTFLPFSIYVKEVFLSFLPAVWYSKFSQRKKWFIDFTKDFYEGINHLLWIKGTLQIEYKNISISVNHLIKEEQKRKNNLYFGLTYIYPYKEFVYFFFGLTFGFSYGEKSQSFGTIIGDIWFSIE